MLYSFLGETKNNRKFLFTPHLPEAEPDNLHEWQPKYVNVVDDAEKDKGPYNESEEVQELRPILSLQCWFFHEGY